MLDMTTPLDRGWSNIELVLIVDRSTIGILSQCIFESSVDCVTWVCSFVQIAVDITIHGWRSCRCLDQILSRVTTFQLELRSVLDGTYQNAASVPRKDMLQHGILD
jgi:hypothetical protein